MKPAAYLFLIPPDVEYFAYSKEEGLKDAASASRRGNTPGTALRRTAVDESSRF